MQKGNIFTDSIEAFKSIVQQRRSKLYNERTYKYVTRMEKADILERFLAFTFDLCIMLSPIYIWLITFIFVLSNFLPISFLDIFTWTILGLLILTVGFVNGLISQYLHGETLGRLYFGFKVVRKDRKEAKASQLFMREFLGFGVPFLLLMYFSSFFGVIIFWLIDATCIFFTKRSWIDFITKTYMVEIPINEDYLLTEEVKEEIYLPTIDLRIHSNFSVKGTYNIEEIFQKAKNLGLKTISITDCNTVKGNAIAKRISELYHINYISGIEIDCSYQGQHLRILGYGIDYQNELYTTLENAYLKKQKQASLERIRLFEDVSGIRLAVNDQMEKSRFQYISSSQLTHYIVDYYRDSMIVKPYIERFTGSDLYQAFHRDYFSKNGKCYVAMQYMDLKDALDIVELTGGIAVLGSFQAMDDFVLEEIYAQGIQGIEAFSPYLSEEEMLQRLSFAKSHSLYVSAGSNFYHYQQTQIGETNCPKEAETIVNMFVEIFMKR